MKHVFLLIFALATAAGCARLPTIIQDGHPTADPALDIISRIYPSGEWQFSHTIHATVPGGKTTEMMGVSVISSTDNSIRCVLMTLEGVVLFSGRFDGDLTVERAISPFDRPGFPEGLMSDLSLLYFPPEIPMTSYGRLSDGSRIVRFHSKEKIAIDLVLRENQTWAVYEYSPGSKLMRFVEARDIFPIGDDGKSAAAKNIVLERPGLLGYRLDMQLVDAIRLSN